MAKILIVGCGDIGTKLAKTLVAKGHNVTGLKRHPPLTPEPGLQYHAADITIAATLSDLATDFEQVFFILAPDGRDAVSYNAVYVDGLNNLLAHFAASGTQPPWLLVSSSSVYGQTQGEWVDETSIAEPTSSTSLAIRAAEQRLMLLSPAHCVLRFSGIYGPGRDYLLRSARQTPAIQKNPPYYTNRIHEQDCINVLVFLLEHRLAGKPLAQCYLASDDDPASQWEVMNWLAATLHCPPPTIKTVAANAEQNKRCNNERLKALGYRFQYPNYQAGYGELLSVKSGLPFTRGL
ncbi:MAG: SDR family oxidoreductase [Methylococcaceae bacterium]|nr:SDR family oxidoreductase [Methylococcaceae bacterium]